MLTEPRDGDNNFVYQNLQLLLDHIESTDLSNENTVDPQSTPTLLTISKSSAIQAALTSGSFISEVLEQQMLNEISDLRATLLSLNTSYCITQNPRKMTKMTKMTRITKMMIMIIILIMIRFQFIKVY